MCIRDRDQRLRHAGQLRRDVPDAGPLHDVREPSVRVRLPGRGESAHRRGTRSGRHPPLYRVPRLHGGVPVRGALLQLVRPAPPKADARARLTADAGATERHRRKVRVLRRSASEGGAARLRLRMPDGCDVHRRPCHRRRGQWSGRDRGALRVPPQERRRSLQGRARDQPPLLLHRRPRPEPGGRGMTTNAMTTNALTSSVREAALRPFGKPSRLWWLAVSALSLIVLAGIAGWVVQLKGGMGVAGYNDHAFWAIYIADVITFIGVSYGGAVISAILRLTGATWRAPLVRLAEGTTVITVLVGTALILPHLGRPDRVWELVTQPNLSAPVFWDLVAVTTYTAASILFFTLPLVPDMAILGQEDGQQLGRRRATLYAFVSRGWIGAPRQRAVLAGALGLVSIMIIPLAVSVHSVLSWAFALVSGPWWHESIWAPYFVVAALYSGVALVILVVAGFRRGYHLEGFITERHFVRLGFLLATLSATYLYLTFADILPGAYVGEPSVAAVFTELLTGHLAVYFWVFIVAAGVLPLLLVALPWTRNVWGMVIASALVAPAMWVKRMLMVVDPSTYNSISGTFSTYHFTWVSISITLAAVAAVSLPLMLLFRVVPLLSIDEIEAVSYTHLT